MRTRRTTLRATGFWTALLLCAACGAGSHAPPAAGERLLIVGWDGATFDLLDPLLAAGRLPNLARLMEGGQSAWLESSRVPISSAAWVGAVTGQHPGENGVYDFFEREPDSYDVRVIDARTNRCPPIWRILSGRGARVNVFGVPITWPPEPVNGRMAAGMLSPPGESWAWPPEYTRQLRDAGLMPDVGIWTQLKNLAPDAVQTRIHEQLAIKEAALIELLQARDWDFSMVVFKSLDVLSHQLYDGDPHGPVADLVERLDGVLGSMLEAAGPETNVFLMSDHGFGTFPKAFNVYAWLIESGYALQAGSPPQAPTVTQPLVSYVAQDEQRRLRRLDLERTRVLASNTECEGNFGSLRLNLVGREPTGVVIGAEREALLSELTQALLAIEADGERLVSRVWRGEQLYPGDARQAVPDLIFETRADHQVVATTTQSTLTHYPQPRPDHRLDGVFVACGPAIAASELRGRFDVFDLAPTALHLMGQAVYEEMSGVARTTLLVDPAPVARIARAADPTYRPPESAWVELSEEQRAAQLEQLKALGYADSDGDG